MTLCLAAAILPATAAADAVTFQADVAHDGNAGAAGITPPLRPAWTARVDGIPSYALIAGDRVFFVVGALEPARSAAVELVAVSARTGRVLWRRPLRDLYTAGIAYDDGRVFVTQPTRMDPGGLAAFDAATGGPLWETTMGGSGGDAPVAQGGVVYARMGVHADVVAAFRQADGAVLWSRSLDNGTDGSFALSADALFMTLPCGDTRALGRSDGAAIWQTPRDCAGGGGTTAVLGAGRVFGPDRALDAATGTGREAGHTDHPPAVAGSVAIHADARRPDEPILFGHVLTARDLTIARTRWRFTGDGYLDTAPLIAGQTVYVGSGGGYIYGVSLRSGRRVWRGAIGVPVNGTDEWHAIQGGLAAAEGLLVVPAYGRVAAFRSR